MVATVFAWFACGLYAWGTSMADLGHFMDTINNQCGLPPERQREYLGQCALVACIGPIGAIAAALGSNFNQHGWELWHNRKKKASMWTPLSS